MKYYEYKSSYGTYKVCLIVNKNANILDINMITDEGEPYADLTVVILDSVNLPEDCAFVDTNNLREAEDFIAENKLGEFTGLVGHSGYCTYPLYRFDLSKLS